MGNYIITNVMKILLYHNVVASEMEINNIMYHNWNHNGNDILM